MKSSQFKTLLASLSPSLPVRIQYGAQLYFVGKIYHEPLNTFIQGAEREGKYPTVQTVLARLNQIDKIIPFDADIVSGDDWNYQDAEVVVSAEMLVIDLSEPVIDDFEEDGELFT